MEDKILSVEVTINGRKYKLFNNVVYLSNIGIEEVAHTLVDEIIKQIIQE